MDNLYALTKNKQAKLRMDLKSFRAPRGKNQTVYAMYDQFWIGDEASSYTLEEISGYKGRFISFKLSVNSTHKGLVKWPSHAAA